MIGFKMDVNSSAVDESDISMAQKLLSQAFRFGNLYLRSSRTIRGRGLRVFKGIGMCAYQFYNICIKGLQCIHSKKLFNYNILMPVKS